MKKPEKTLLCFPIFNKLAYNTTIFASMVIDTCLKTDFLWGNYEKFRNQTSDSMKREIPSPAHNRPDIDPSALPFCKNQLFFFLFVSSFTC
jgi:hypothetical protein